jgi:hypothetical protein
VFIVAVWAGGDGGLVVGRDVQVVWNEEDRRRVKQNLGGY